MKPYEFDYNVSYDNDKLGKHDLMLPVRAELLSMCPGIPPIVMICFRETYAANIQRVINIDAAVRDMEAIAVCHFSNLLQEPLMVVKIAS